MSDAKYKRAKKLAEAEAKLPPDPGPRPDGGSALDLWKVDMRAYALSSFKRFARCNGRLYDYYAPLHDRMCDKYESALPRPDVDKIQRRSMRMYPRNTLKTTAGIELLAYAILKNPKIQIHYVRTTADLAADGLFELRNEALNTPFVRDMWGDITSELTLDNQYELSLGTNKDPTVRAVGVTGAITGTHIHFVWLDDLITDENYNSAKLRRNINSRMAQYRPILHPVYGAMMLTGTYWPKPTYHDQVVEENEKLEKRIGAALETANLEEARTLRHKLWDIDIAGVHNPDGSLLFPTKITEDFLRLVREDKDEGMFYAGWYEMVPASDGKKPFPREERSFFNGNLYHEPYPHIELMDDLGRVLRRIPVDVYTTYDATLTAGDTSDDVGIVTLGVDADDEWWVLYAKEHNMIPSDMVDITAMELRVFRPIKLGYEPAALSGEMVANVQKIIMEEDLPTIIVDLKHLSRNSTRRNKEKRINSMQTRYRKRQIHIQTGPMCATLQEQMDGWPMIDKKDVLDALSMHLDFARPCQVGELDEVLDDPMDEEDHPLLEAWLVKPYANMRVADGCGESLKEFVQENKDFVTNMASLVSSKEEKQSGRVGGHVGGWTRRRP